MKYAAVFVALLVALVGFASAQTLVCAGPADFGYGSEVPPAAVILPVPPVNVGIVNDDADYYVHYYYDGVGESAVAAVKEKLQKAHGHIDAFTPTTKHNVPLGRSLNAIQEIEFSGLFGDYAKVIV